MNGRAYYNEHDPGAAAWLRELVQSGLIAPGDVDERSISDVLPSDLRGYAQCHFFAGIAGWSLALRLAGWPDDRPVWTGSCPCQPFSAAGARGGFADERHLWPDFHWLIEQCRPSIVFGEQVASRAGLDWLDLVQADLEGSGYAVGKADLCAAGVGAPHIRQRLWFVADGGREGWRQVGSNLGGRREGGRQEGVDERPMHCGTGSVANGIGPRLEGRDARALGDECATAERGRTAGRMGDANGHGLATGHEAAEAVGYGRPSHPWSDLEWLPCRDGKARPTQRRLQSVVDGLWPSLVESGADCLQPLALAQAHRAAILRGAGNAIVPQVAEAFVRAFTGGQL